MRIIIDTSVSCNQISLLKNPVNATFITEMLADCYPPKMLKGLPNKEVMIKKNLVELISV